MKPPTIIFTGLVVVGVAILLLIYGPLMYQEVGQLVRMSTPTASDIKPINTDFAIVIPKIGANSPIIGQVDPQNSDEYMQALSKGVAHAKGSVLPDQQGTVFLFAHSSMNYFEARKFNSVFYLLHWLKPSDEIEVFYKGNRYIYRVEKLERVAASQVEYLYQFQPQQKLVLMTCWPPGTDYKRLVVTAMLKE